MFRMFNCVCSSRTGSPRDPGRSVGCEVATAGVDGVGVVGVVGVGVVGAGVVGVVDDGVGVAGVGVDGVGVAGVGVGATAPGWGALPRTVVACVLNAVSCVWKRVRKNAAAVAIRPVAASLMPRSP